MDDFYVEYYISDKNSNKICLSDLKQMELFEWKKDVEKQALSEYYNKKIKILKR